MLREALAFPRNRDGAMRDLLIGAALVLSSPLVVPSLLLYGYLLAVMNAAARGREVPPAFGDWGGLLADGLRAVVVWLVYGLLPAALAVGVPVAGYLLVFPLGRLRSMSHTRLGLLLAVVAVLWLAAFVLALHLPAALVAVATQNRLGAAFQTDALWAVVSTKQYLVGLVLALLAGLFGSLLAAVFTPVLVGFVLLFYVQVVVAYLLGRAVGGAAVTAIRPA